MIEHFLVQIIWKILLKIIKNPGKLKFTDLPHGILFCQERPGILEGIHKSIFFTQSILWKPFLTPHSPYPKCPPSQIDFLKRNQTKF